jgi:hypothetical protein
LVSRRYTAASDHEALVLTSLHSFLACIQSYNYKRLDGQFRTMKPINVFSPALTLVMAPSAFAGPLLGVGCVSGCVAAAAACNAAAHATGWMTFGIGWVAHVGCHNALHACLHASAHTFVLPTV